ncbi:unnamed protein product [Paramecium sonneborni]|uniref:Uncharacterized protein n=1 Tax=Paramecium sonneborni TaxID=65129 RepID=A0A8S1M1K3_9CILI|nr:unnamed protein product [Paramecium sonneborni]
MLFIGESQQQLVHSFQFGPVHQSHDGQQMIYKFEIKIFLSETNPVLILEDVNVIQAEPEETIVKLTVLTQKGRLSQNPVII